MSLTHRLVLAIILIAALSFLASACQSSSPPAAETPAQTPDEATTADSAQADASEAAEAAAPAEESALAGEASSAGDLEAADEDFESVLSQVAENPAPLIAADSDDPASEKAAMGANDFAFRLASALAADAKGENFFISPFSVWLPLAALVNATKESGREELLEAISVGGLSPDDIDKASSRLLYSLTNVRSAELDPEGFKSPVKIANAVFVGRDWILNLDFSRKFLDYYRGTSFEVDFLSPLAVDAVNNWVDENTEGKIANIVSEFTPDTVAVLANAIFMSDSWVHAFPEDATKPGAFHGPKGDVETLLMEKSETFSYYEDAAIQAAALPLVNSSGLYVIVPKSGDPYSVLDSLSGARLEEINQKSQRRQGRVVLPRLKIQSETLELGPVLEKLGVKLFDPSAALLTGGLVEGAEPVFLSKAFHKAMIEIDENGLTAAAATIMVAATRAMLPEGEPFELICDKPFLMVVYGKSRDNPVQVLFTGIVNDPSRN